MKCLGFWVCKLIGLRVPSRVPAKLEANTRNAVQTGWPIRRHQNINVVAEGCANEETLRATCPGFASMRAHPGSQYVSRQLKRKLQASNLDFKLGQALAGPDL